MRTVQRFEVSLKAFIVSGGRVLFVREADSGHWELPGGRIDAGEEWQLHADVLRREIREELGDEVQVAIRAEAVTWTRQRPSDGVFQFIVARVGHIEAGTPSLSGEHSELCWLDRAASRQLEFPPDSGYLAGIDALWSIQENAS